MNTSEHILSDQVVLSPGQPSPRVLTLPRPEHELSTALWTCERAILLGMLMVVPLLFGAVQPWAWGSITLVATALLLVWAVGRVQRGSVRVLWSPLLLPIAAALILAAVQTFGGLSHDHVATREAFIKLLTYGLIFFVAQQLYVSASAKAWRNSGIAISAYMFAMAAFGMAQYFASPGLLYGYLPESNSVFGPYVNHGNYAGLMEMLIPIALTFAISLRWKHPAKPFVLFLAFIAVVSVFLSGSRAGLVSLAVEFLLVAAVLISTRSNQKHLVLVGMAAACLAVGVFYWLDPGETWGRWQQMASRPELALGNRQTIAFDTLRMTRDHLAHGVGLGGLPNRLHPVPDVGDRSHHRLRTQRLPSIRCGNRQLGHRASARITGAVFSAGVSPLASANSSAARLAAIWRGGRGVRITRSQLLRIQFAHSGERRVVHLSRGYSFPAHFARATDSKEPWPQLRLPAPRRPQSENPACGPCLRGLSRAMSSMRLASGA